MTEKAMCWGFATAATCIISRTSFCMMTNGGCHEVLNAAAMHVTGSAQWPTSAAIHGTDPHIDLPAMASAPP